MRATEPMPNQWFAGFSSVHQCSATSASGAPNGRPMTAVAVWYTGSPPGRAAGNRTRSRCSLPIDPDTWVRNSTRSAPSHSSVSAVTARSPSEYEATSRDPTGERCARTVAAPDDAAMPGPLGDRCHGPSFQRGCCWYSSCSTRSLPGLVSSSRPAALSMTEASAPWPVGAGHRGTRRSRSPARRRPPSRRCQAPAAPARRHRRRRGAAGSAGTRAAAPPARGTSASPRRASRPACLRTPRRAPGPGRRSPGR